MFDQNQGPRQFPEHGREFKIFTGNANPKL